jgi:hypothetical protein
VSTNIDFYGSSGKRVGMQETLFEKSVSHTLPKNFSILAPVGRLIAAS